MHQFVKRSCRCIHSYSVLVAFTHPPAQELSFHTYRHPQQLCVAFKSDTRFKKSWASANDVAETARVKKRDFLMTWGGSKG